MQPFRIARVASTNRSRITYTTMKMSNIFSKLFLAGGLILTAGITSCDDYLTVLPTDQITEEDFWNDKNDLNNVRAAAYAKMVSGDVTNRMFVWGEVRSDNLRLNDLSNTSMQYIMEGVLQPTEGLFSWEHFYTGINYCNKVLEYGAAMASDGRDPSFGESDWAPLKAEMLALRSLYYFHLVRAYRDVPFVTKSISTDAEAKRANTPQSKGVEILATLLQEMEDAVDKAVENYGSAIDNKGRFTKRSIHALMADMYLWRACMLRSSSAKGDNVANASDEITNCLNKTIEHADFVLNHIQAEYDQDELENPTPNKREGDHLTIDWLTVPEVYSVNDVVYQTIFGQKNATYESIFELQYDGTNNVNNTYGNYLSSYANNLSTKALVISSSLISSINSYNPEKGFGQSDNRLLSTIRYEKSNNTGAYPVLKNVARSIDYNDRQDMTAGANYQFRESSNMDANWPVYRAADVMLIKAEAVARLHTSVKVGSYKNDQNQDAMYDDRTKVTDANQLLVMQCFDLVNALFKRSNPTLENPLAAVINNPEKTCDRLSPAYPLNKTGADLLNLVYNERQREFVGEGKRWYDLVRQAEYENTTANVLSTHMSVTTTVRNRLKLLLSFYNPIHAEEMKIAGVENGGSLVQNPVWDRYTKK